MHNAIGPLQFITQNHLKEWIVNGQIKNALKQERSFVTVKEAIPSTELFCLNHYLRAVRRNEQPPESGIQIWTLSTNKIRKEISSKALTKSPAWSIVCQ